MVPLFSTDVLRALCNVVADTSTGLTGGEIGLLLRECGISDPLPGATKRYRLYEALSARQANDKCGNHVAAFVQAAMRPVLYLDRKDDFVTRRDAINTVLAFSGISLDESGDLRATTKVRTISDAEKRATKLRQALEDRSVHADVLRCCRAELVQDNYFHAVLEAAKSVALKLRAKSGIDGDGAALVDAALSAKEGSYPVLALNAYRSITEVGEHRGIMNLLKGLFGTFRNPLAHETKITWSVDEQDALDMLSLASMLHRRLDAAVLTGVAQSNAKVSNG